MHEHTPPAEAPQTLASGGAQSATGAENTSDTDHRSSRRASVQGRKAALAGLASAAVILAGAGAVVAGGSLLPQADSSRYHCPCSGEDHCCRSEPRQRRFASLY